MTYAKGLGCGHGTRVSMIIVADHSGYGTVSPSASGGWFGSSTAPGLAPVPASATGAAMIWVCRLPGW
jgi:hypothetical protein